MLNILEHDKHFNATVANVKSPLSQLFETPEFNERKRKFEGKDIPVILHEF